VHALGMFAVALLIPKFGPVLLGWAGSAMFIGILIFSGSLYILALSGIRILGAITPIGGVAFLISWVLIAWAAYKGPTPTP